MEGVLVWRERERMLLLACERMPSEKDCPMTTQRDKRQWWSMGFRRATGLCRFMKLMPLPHSFLMLSQTVSRLSSV